MKKLVEKITLRRVVTVLVVIVAYLAAGRMQLIDPLTEEIIQKAFNGALVVGIVLVLWYFLQVERSILDSHPEWESATIEAIERVASIVGFIGFMVFKLVNNYRSIVP